MYIVQTGSSIRIKSCPLLFTIVFLASSMFLKDRLLS